MRPHDCTPSPNSRKVESLFGYLGVSVDRQFLDLFQGAQRSESFLALDPNGKIPDSAIGPRAESAPTCGLGYGNYPAMAAWLERVTRLPGWVPQPPLGR